jgi:hypothetical protein
LKNLLPQKISQQSRNACPCYAPLPDAVPAAAAIGLRERQRRPWPVRVHNDDLHNPICPNRSARLFSMDFPPARLDPPALRRAKLALLLRITPPTVFPA